jgi:ribosomal protein S18 acetylase RimI-like enzyme
MTRTETPLSSIALRPVAADDAALLEALYRASRADEVAAWGWNDGQVEAFLEMQWQIERRARAIQHPNAEHRIVVLDGRAVGRLLVDRTSDEIRIVDIGLLPEARGRGIGTALLGDLIAEAEARAVRIVLSVRRGNAAERLYRRLGFTVTGEDELQIKMAFCPLPHATAESGSSRREECQIRL